MNMRMNGIRSKIFVGSTIIVILCLMLPRNLRSYVQYQDLLSTTTRSIKDESVEQIGEKIGDASVSRTDAEATIDVRERNFSIDDHHEPYLNRWQRRFASSEERNKTGGYLFFRHTRKAGGTTLRGYFRDVLAYHNVTRNLNDWKAANHGIQTNKYQIHYIEHEFQTIDWQCPTVDPRWQESLRIIVLRHPIERHLSEFFFSGNGKKFYPINKQQLSSNQTYREELGSFISVQLPKWMKHIGLRNSKRRQKEAIELKEGKFNMLFGAHYTDNFQLRALAGCSSGDCLDEKNVTETQMGKINEFHPSSYSYSEPVPRCTNFFRKDDTNALMDVCAKPGHAKEYCSVGCDGPCFYPSVAWGKLGAKDITRAVNTLKAFDAVLVMEKLDEQEQSDFLSDIFGVPRGADFSLAKRGGTSNMGVIKKSKEEMSRFYRNLLLKLGLKHMNNMLHKENELEIKFFDHAVLVNAMMIEQWKRENIDI